MQSLGVQPRPTGSDPLILGPSNLCCNKPPRAMVKVTNPVSPYSQHTPRLHLNADYPFAHWDFIVAQVPSFCLHSENAGAIRLSLDKSGALGRAADALRKVKEVKVKVAQSCLTLCDPMDSTVHGILQARILEWVAFPFPRGSSKPRDQTLVSHIAGRFFTSWATRVLPKTWMLTSGPRKWPHPITPPGFQSARKVQLPSHFPRLRK